MNSSAPRPPLSRSWWRGRTRVFFGVALTLIAGTASLSLHSCRDPLPPLPTIAGQPESCLLCHAGMTGFASAHDPAALGCAVCHLGDRRSRTAGKAHAGMTRTPGNLSIVRQTCATANCHAAIGERVRGSLMATMSGVVAVDHFVFDESPDLDRPFDVARVGHSRADSHLRTLCASCHLGHDKSAPAPLDESSRGGGCSACHLDYGPRATEELAHRNRPGLPPLDPQAHPMISVRIPEQACFGCHSRSGRIATNYEGWHETRHDAPPAPTTVDTRERFRVLSDGRVFEKMPADVHFTAGLSCTDCHLASEVMGDGRAHAHEEGAVKIACLDCHDDRPPVTRTLAELDPETRLIATLRGLATPGRRFVQTHSGKAAFPNVFVEPTGTTQLIPLRAGLALTAKPRTAACARDGTAHAALDCRACHAAWTSQCVSCHTAAEPRTPGWDHLADQPSPDSWRETADHFLADPPTLGVALDPLSDSRAIPTGASPTTATPRIRVTTVAPGMILTLNQSTAAAKKPDTFHRLFAPVSPHTTTRRSRDCQSCHSNSAALGYGRGQLHYEIAGDTGRWRFTPEFPPLSADGLPADAWIGFLQSREGAVATRTNVRPFTVDEQHRLLLVGACLTCHAGDSDVMQQSLTDFPALRARRRPICALPLWP